MMDLRIGPRLLQGTVPAIPSKSMAHRLLILAALAEKPTEIGLPRSSADIEHTIRCLQALGAGVSRSGSGVVVTPIAKTEPSPLLTCGESGSTLRFLLPLAAALGGGASFSGEGRLPGRPLGDLVAAMKKNGISFSQERLPLAISGKLQPGEYVLPGNVSSQYVTGLLLVLPGLACNSAIRIAGRLESSPYVEMTLASLRSFGVQVQKKEGGFEIRGGQKYISPGKVGVEGDWSNAAFFLAAGALGGPVTVTGLDPRSAQGDRAVVPLLERFGAITRISGDGVTVSGAGTAGCEVDVSEVPDLLPALAALAASACGTTRFRGCGRLRYKESDRISAVAAMIGSLGGDAEESPAGLLVRGRRLAGGTVSSFGDHRIAMAAAVAATGCAGKVTILDAGVVEKSSPDFFAHYLALGGKADGI